MCHSAATRCVRHPQSKVCVLALNFCLCCSDAAVIFSLWFSPSSYIYMLTAPEPLCALQSCLYSPIVGSASHFESHRPNSWSWNHVIYASQFRLWAHKLLWFSIPLKKACSVSDQVGPQWSPAAQDKSPCDVSFSCNL